jgi:chromosome segregation ATPase
MDANYLKLKSEKDSLNVEHNKLQKYYTNMEQTLLKQHKELEELKEEIGNVCQSKNEI